MLSTSFARFFHENVMDVIRKRAQMVAVQYSDPGVAQFCTRWGDNMYKEGTKIADKKEFDVFYHAVEEDIAALERQAKIRKMFE